MEEVILKIINFLYSFLKVKREIEYKKRLQVAKEFVEKLEDLSDLSLKYEISGSTNRKDFCFHSDIDIDIICRNDIDVQKVYKFTHYLIMVFVKKYNYFIDCYITSEEFIQRFTKIIAIKRS